MPTIMDFTAESGKIPVWSQHYPDLPVHSPVRRRGTWLHAIYSPGITAFWVIATGSQVVNTGNQATICSCIRIFSPLKSPRVSVGEGIRQPFSLSPNFSTARKEGTQDKKIWELQETKQKRMWSKESLHLVRRGLWGGDGGTLHKS